MLPNILFSIGLMLVSLDAGAHESVSAPPAAASGGIPRCSDALRTPAGRERARSALQQLALERVTADLAARGIRVVGAPAGEVFGDRVSSDAAALTDHFEIRTEDGTRLGVEAMDVGEILGIETKIGWEMGIEQRNRFDSRGEGNWLGASCVLGNRDTFYQRPAFRVTNLSSGVIVADVPVHAGPAPGLEQKERVEIPLLDLPLAE